MTGRRSRMRSLSLVLLAVVLVAGAASGQDGGSDVIRRVEQTGGRVTWQLAGSFSCGGESWAGVDRWGVAYAAVQTIERRGLTVSGTVCLDEHVRLGAALNVDRIDSCVRIETDDSLSDERSTEQGTSFSIDAAFSGDGGHPFDPRVWLTLASFGTAWEHHTPGMLFGIAGSVSYILDPVVFAGTLDWNLTSEPPNQRLSTTFSVGLVANSRVTMILAATLRRAIGAIAVPSSTIAFLTCVSLASDRSGRIELRISFDPGNTTEAMTIVIGVGGVVP